MNKYELLKTDTITAHTGATLYRIKALKAFGNVKAEELGGYVESEVNLSQDGDAWVYGSAQVFGDAQVSGDAQVFGSALVYGDARVYGSAWVYGNAQVFDSARVYGSARVSGSALVSGSAWVYDSARVYGSALVSGSARVFGSAWVYDSARVYGSARVFGDAWVYGDVKVSKTPIVISGVKYTITITESHIFIGCEGHTIAHWKKNIVTIGKANGYSNGEIKQVIKFLKAAGV
jgi:carbonic anhydrase/acetyltransferase-like protein (isoleucine patch superfamily)